MNDLQLEAALAAFIALHRDKLWPSDLRTIELALSITQRCSGR